MRFLIPVALLAVAFMGCRGVSPRAEDWVASAPEKSVMGVSCHLGWMLEMPEFRQLVTRYPVFDQALELFLDRAKIDPASETGRVSVYALKIPNMDTASANDLRETALIQIAGFRDPKAIQQVIAETFPPEGSLSMGGREYPLFVVLDMVLDKIDIHIRMFTDGDGRLWIGDLAAFQDLSKKRQIGIDGPIPRASEWVSPSGAVQGFVQPELIPKDALKELAGVIPAGIKGLAWSFSPTQSDGQIISLDLAVTGTDEAVTKLKPWMQRLFTMASTLAGEGAGQPETVQEGNRMGIRCQFRQDQLSSALDMINLKDLIPIPAETEFPKSGKATGKAK